MTAIYFHHYSYTTLLEQRYKESSGSVRQAGAKGAPPEGSQRIVIGEAHAWRQPNSTKDDESLRFPANQKFRGTLGPESSRENIRLSRAHRESTEIRNSIDGYALFSSTS